MEQAREKKVPNDERTTTPYLTKYERARVLGTRALQIRCVAIRGMNGRLSRILNLTCSLQYERTRARRSGG